MVVCRWLNTPRSCAEPSSKPYFPLFDSTSRDAVDLHDIGRSPTFSV